MAESRICPRQPSTTSAPVLNKYLVKGTRESLAYSNRSLKLRPVGFWGRTVGG